MLCVHTLSIQTGGHLIRRRGLFQQEEATGEAGWVVLPSTGMLLDGTDNALRMHETVALLERLRRAGTLRDDHAFWLEVVPSAAVFCVALDVASDPDALRTYDHWNRRHPELNLTLANRDTWATALEDLWQRTGERHRVVVANNVPGPMLFNMGGGLLGQGHRGLSAWWDVGLRKTLPQTTADRGLLLRLSQLQAKLKHNNVLRILDIEWDREHGAIHVWSPWCAAGNMLGFVNPVALWHPPRDPWLPRLLRDAWNGLEFLHRQRYLHTDIKPANIFVHVLPGPVYGALLGDIDGVVPQKRCRGNEPHTPCYGAAYRGCNPLRDVVALALTSAECLTEMSWYRFCLEELGPEQAVRHGRARNRTAFFRREKNWTIGLYERYARYIEEQNRVKHWLTPRMLGEFVDMLKRFELGPNKSEPPAKEKPVVNLMRQILEVWREEAE